RDRLSGPPAQPCRPRAPWVGRRRGRPGPRHRGRPPRPRDGPLLPPVAVGVRGDRQRRPGPERLERGRTVTVETETEQATNLDRLAVDTVRVLAMDTIQKAGSGHP